MLQEVVSATIVPLHVAMEVTSHRGAVGILVLAYYCTMSTAQSMWQPSHKGSVRVSPWDRESTYLKRCWPPNQLSNHWLGIAKFRVSVWHIIQPNCLPNMTHKIVAGTTVYKGQKILINSNLKPSLKHGKWRYGELLRKQWLTGRFMYSWHILSLLSHWAIFFQVYYFPTQEALASFRLIPSSLLKSTQCHRYSTAILPRPAILIPTITTADESKQTQTK